MPDIAIVIPARNVERTIGRTIDLVAEQVAALRDGAPAMFCEVVVVDDASTDATPECAERACAELTGATVLRRPRRGGANAARNDGVRATSAPVVVFLDGDDEPLPGWLAALGSAVDAPDVIAGGTYVIPGPGGREAIVAAHTRRAFGYAFAVGGALATSRALLTNMGGFDESLVRGGTEVELCIRGQREHGARVVAVDEARVRHRVPMTVIGRAHLHHVRERGHADIRRRFTGPEGAALPARTSSASWRERVDVAGSWTLLMAEITGRATGRLRFTLLPRLSLREGQTAPQTDKPGAV